MAGLIWAVVAIFWVLTGNTWSTVIYIGLSLLQLSVERDRTWKTVGGIAVLVPIVLLIHKLIYGISYLPTN